MNVGRGSTQTNMYVDELCFFDFEYDSVYPVLASHIEIISKRKNNTRRDRRILRRLSKETGSKITLIMIDHKLKTIQFLV
jgi:hypothetical protein